MNITALIGRLNSSDPDFDDCEAAATALRILGDQGKAMHTALCQAVSILNVSPEMARLEDGRKVSNILRQALVDFADMEPKT